MYEVKAAGKVSIVDSKEEMKSMLSILKSHGWHVMVRKVGGTWAETKDGRIA